MVTRATHTEPGASADALMVTACVQLEPVQAGAWLSSTAGGVAIGFPAGSAQARLTLSASEKFSPRKVTCWPVALTIDDGVALAITGGGTSSSLNPAEKRATDPSGFTKTRS